MIDLEAGFKIADFADELVEFLFGVFHGIFGLNALRR
jgi:hypothetical protein